MFTTTVLLHRHPLWVGFQLFKQFKGNNEQREENIVQWLNSTIIYKTVFNRLTIKQISSQISIRNNLIINGNWNLFNQKQFLNTQILLQNLSSPRLPLSLFSIHPRNTIYIHYNVSLRFLCEDHLENQKA